MRREFHAQNVCWQDTDRRIRRHGHRRPSANLRKLGVAGQEAAFVQYQLDDPDEYEDETIVVVGAGDAAIENAVALAKQNSVIIVNRRDEFARAKQGNLDLILKCIEDGVLECMYSTTPARVEETDPASNNGKPGMFVLNTPDGEADIPVDRIIARLGGVPPRRFVESTGIEFPSDDPAAVPAVSPQYESECPWPPHYRGVGRLPAHQTMHEPRLRSRGRVHRRT